MARLTKGYADDLKPADFSAPTTSLFGTGYVKRRPAPAAYVHNPNYFEIVITLVCRLPTAIRVERSIILNILHGYA